MPRPKGAKNKNHKEKPVKEKKEKKERKKHTKQKQHQEQHQIVNVNINTKKGKSSDDEEKKEKKRKVRNAFQSMIPNNIIFNPSLNIPSAAPINKPDTNPPYYDMSSLIQSMQQTIQQPNPRIPINPPKLNPPVQQPITPAEPTPINTVDVEPTQPQPTQPTPYYPNPQPTPKPKPKKPVIIPGVPTQTYKETIETYPYNDVLGTNLVNLATSIGLGAVTGGVSVAAESALAGAAEGFAASGLRGIAGGAASGVAASVPIMTRAGIAGGVATGVSHVLGGGQAGNIIAGVAGGLASRGRSGAVGGAIAGAMNNVSSRVRPTNRTRGRVRLVHDSDNAETSLLSSSRPFAGEGNIAGGNSTGVSRLVEPQIPVPSEPVNNIMSNIRNVANRTMASANETVSNLRNQISEVGEDIMTRVRPRRRGRHVPQSDETGWEIIEPPVASINPAANVQPSDPLQEAASRLKAVIKRTKRQIEYEQNVQMDKELKVKNTQMSKSILNDIVNGSVNQSETRGKAASRIKAAMKRIAQEPKILKEQYKKAVASTKIKAALKGAIQRKQDRAGINMSNLTEQLNQTVKYGKSQTVLNEFSAKRQNISNFGKLSKGATDDLKERWIESIKDEQARRKKISNFGKLTLGLQQQKQQQRLGAASMQPIQHETGTRSGAAFTATDAQLNAPSRMQLHRERNPELTQLRQHISDFKRGKLQLSDIQKTGIETRIDQLVEINKALRTKGQGPKLGRPTK